MKILVAVKRVIDYNVQVRVKEDGIRDVHMSRGLGDVYKRQV